MIVLNENDWARDMVSAKTLGKKPSETLRRVARYFADSTGQSKAEVRKAMDDFLLQCDPRYSLVKWSAALDYAVNYAFKHEAIAIDGIDITEPELKRIEALDGKQIKRLAFTLLCLSRYWDIANSSSEHWVNTKDSEIMTLANISTSIKRQSLMYYALHEAGMVDFSKRVDNTNVRVTFAADGPTALTVTDFRNLGYQYMRYYGGPYTVCVNCGITFHYSNRGAGRPKKYCDSCAAKIKIQQSVNSVMRHRARPN